MLARRSFLLMPALGLWPLAGCNAQTPADGHVSVDEARRLLERGEARVFDIREPSEHATGVARGMALLPMSQLKQRLGEIPQDPNQPVLLICNTQNRSGKVMRAMREAGWTNVRFVQGGMSEWARRGWPLVKPAAP